jgi:hypothetical protein
MNHSLVVVILSFLAASLSEADYLVWDYSMQSCPPGWGYYDWSFTPSGAYSSLHADIYSTSETSALYSESGDAAIPSGCDSVILHASQILDLSSSPGAGCAAAINYRINGGGWTMLWEYPLNPGVYTDTAPINYVIPVTSPCTVGVYFYLQAYSMPYPQGGSAFSEWTIADLSLTVCGDFPGLTPESWACIKALFQALPRLPRACSGAPACRN